jgi:pilus assembly protein CpaB
MGGRSFAILGLAVGCGLVAMYGASQLIGGKDKPVVMSDVLVAARDLRAEEILKPEMYKLVKVPADKVDPGAITDPKALEGRWVEIPMLSGETIVEGKLAAKDAVPGLPGRIPAGMRAFSIEVSEESGVAGFVLPGYHVDIIQEIRDDTNPRRRPPARLVLQDVLVLAAGQVVTRGEDKSINVRTVTLAVEPDQAETLVAARTRGPLSLALRGLDDHEIVARPDPRDEDPEPLVALTPLVAPLPERQPTPAPRPLPPPAPKRRTLIIHGLQRPVTIHHRLGPDPGPPAAGPAVASAAPGSTASARRPPGTLATP